jgi:hypothetical protein
MVTMSTVWDRSTEVMAGRFGMLATIAGLLGVLPRVLQSTLVPPRIVAGMAMAPGPAAAASGVAALASLVVALCAIWSGLALVAAASSPAIDSVGAALATSARRLPVAIGLTLLIGIVAVVVLIVPIVILGASGMNMAALRTGDVAHAFSPGAVLGVVIGFLIALIVGLWLTARLFLFNPVLVNERRGFGSIARSFALTRGLTWRLIGVLLLFGIVFLVLTMAVGSVAGILFGLLLGSGAPTAALVLTQLTTSTVSAGFAIVFATFSAQLYRSITGTEAAEAFE